MLYFSNQEYLKTLENRGFKRVKTIKEWIENPDKTYYLKYDGRTYGYKINGIFRLYSYDTLVSWFDLNDFEWINFGWYSKTTQKHQFDFLDTLAKYYGLNYSPIYTDENIKSGREFMSKIRSIRFDSKRYSTKKNVKINGNFMVYLWRI